MHVFDRRLFIFLELVFVILTTVVEFGSLSDLSLLLGQCRSLLCLSVFTFPHKSDISEA